MHRYLILPLFALLTACPAEDDGSSDPVDIGVTADSGFEADAATDPTTDGDIGQPDSGNAEPGCVPAASQYDSVVSPILTSYCSQCHGTEPAFGAPFSLLDGYADLVAGDAGERKIDAMLTKLLEGTMPPAFAPQLPHGDLDTLVGWLSCGMEHPDPSTGLEANREVWDAPEMPPAGTVPLEVRPDAQSIGPDIIDDYRNFRFSNLVDEDRFVRRIEPIIDDGRVLHHITFTTGSGQSPTYWYAWAPGTGAIEFPDGGMRIKPGDEFTLQIHYNNGAGVPDAVDRSGVRLYLGDPVGTEYGMMSPTTFAINVPAKSTATATKTCTATMDFDIIAGFPHMHEIGSTFTHDLIRTDGTIENLITLTGWQFEAQYFYEMPVSVKAGDQLRMVCGYDNPTNRTVIGGQNTSDEMCFDFMVVVPAEAAAQCPGFF